MTALTNSAQRGLAEAVKTERHALRLRHVGSRVRILVGKHARAGRFGVIEDVEIDAGRGLWLFKCAVMGMGFVDRVSYATMEIDLQ